MPSSQWYDDLNQKDVTIIVNYSISATKLRMKKSPELLTVDFCLF